MTEGLSPSQSAPGVRILLGYSPYYSPSDPPAPNPGNENPSPDSHPFDHLQATGTTRPADNADPVIPFLAEALKGRAVVRPAAGTESPYPMPAAATTTESIRAHGKGRRQNLTEDSPADEKRPSRMVVIEFPPNTPLGEAVDLTTRHLRSIQEAQIVRTVQAGKTLADSLQERMRRCRKDCETLRIYAEQAREAREAFRTLISTLVVQLSTHNRGLEAELPDDLLALESRYRALVEKRRALLATRTPEHPEVKQVDAALGELEAQLRLRLRDAKGGSQQSPGVQQWPPAWITLPDHEHVASNPRSLPETQDGGTGPSLSLSAGTPAVALMECLLKIEARYEGLDSIGQDLAQQVSSVAESADELSQRLGRAIHECRAALSWRIVGTELPSRKTESALPGDFPPWWHWLLALLVSVFSGEATYALVEAVMRPRAIRSPEDIQEVIPVPVFNIELPATPVADRTGSTRLRADAGHLASASPPHTRHSKRAKTTPFQS